MNLRLTLVTLASFLLFYSCKKADHQPLENNVSTTLGKNILEKFFSIKEKTDPITLMVLNEVKKRNEISKFVEDFAQTNGFPIWSKAVVASRLNEDTVVYIPLVLNKTRFTNGFIKAVINKGITISSFKASDYSNYPFSENASFSADNFTSMMMYFNNKVFHHDRFILTDSRLFPSASSGKNQFGNREIKLLKTRQGNLNARTTDCELMTIVIEWLEQDPGNCTCNNGDACDWATGCSDCSNLYTTYFSFSSCAGGSSGSTSSGGYWNPAPPPGGGGSSGTMATPSGGYLLYPNTQEYFDFVDYTLTPNERDFWDNPYKAEFVAPLIRKLVHGNYSSSTVASIQDWLSYLMGNPDITPAEFVNYFMYESEGSDGVYDATYWEDQQLTFQLEPLPSWAAFRAAFPKEINPQTGEISEMHADDVFNMVGGVMDANHDNRVPGWSNACAIRGSRALNYCGKPIVNTSNKVYTGADGKKYIIQAKAFNTYMNRKFGAPTHILTALEINGNPQKIVDFLRGKTGIYTMVTSGGPFTGHVDMIENGQVLGGAATDVIGNVEKIEIWELK